MRLLATPLVITARAALTPLIDARAGLSEGHAADVTKRAQLYTELIECWK